MNVLEDVPGGDGVEGGGETVAHRFIGALGFHAVGAQVGEDFVVDFGDGGLPAAAFHFHGERAGAAADVEQPAAERGGEVALDGAGSELGARAAAVFLA